MSVTLSVALSIAAHAVQDRPPLPPPPGPYPTAPLPEPPGPGVRVIDYIPDVPVAVSVAPNRQLTIVFYEDERVENVALGDSNGWQVALSGRRDHLFVKPVQDRTSTNMTVVTSARTYLFELNPGTEYETPVYTLRFLPPREAIVQRPPPRPPSGAIGYRLTGARALHPSGIRDDGIHTYLEWPEDVSMPAVFGIDESGEEMLVDGYVRGGVYTLDRVYSRLVFRMGKLRARAERQIAQAPQ